MNFMDRMRIKKGDDVEAPPVVNSTIRSATTGMSLGLGSVLGSTRAAFQPPTQPVPNPRGKASRRESQCGLLGGGGGGGDVDVDVYDGGKARLGTNSEVEDEDGTDDDAEEDSAVQRPESIRAAKVGVTGGVGGILGTMSIMTAMTSSTATTNTNQHPRGKTYDQKGSISTRLAKAANAAMATATLPRVRRAGATTTVGGLSNAATTATASVGGSLPATRLSPDPAYFDNDDDHDAMPSPHSPVGSTRSAISSSTRSHRSNRSEPNTTVNNNNSPSATTTSKMVLPKLWPKVLPKAPRLAQDSMASSNHSTISQRSGGGTGRGGTLARTAPAAGPSQARSMRNLMPTMNMPTMNIMPTMNMNMPTMNMPTMTLPTLQLPTTMKNMNIQMQDMMMGHASKGSDDPGWGSLDDSSTFSLPDPSEFLEVEDSKLENSFKKEEPDALPSSLPSFSKNKEDFFAAEWNTNDKTIIGKMSNHTTDTTTTMGTKSNHGTIGKTSNHTTDTTSMGKKSNHSTIGKTSNHTTDTTSMGKKSNHSVIGKTSNHTTDTTSMGKKSNHSIIGKTSNHTTDTASMRKKSNHRTKRSAELNTASTASTATTSESANTSEEDSTKLMGGVSFGHLSWSESNSDLNKSKNRISALFNSSWSDSQTEGQKSKTGTTEIGTSFGSQTWACFDDSNTNTKFNQSKSSAVENNDDDRSDRSSDSDDEDDYLGGYTNNKEHPIFMQGSKRVSSVPAPIQFEIPVPATATEPLVTPSLDMQ